MITKSFTRDRETRRTIRYAEVGPEAEHAVGYLYVKKTALEKLGNPSTLAVVIGTTAEFEADGDEHA